MWHFFLLSNGLSRSLGLHPHSHMTVSILLAVQFTPIKPPWMLLMTSMTLKRFRSKRSHLSGSIDTFCLCFFLSFISQTWAMSCLIFSFFPVPHDACHSPNSLYPFPSKYHLRLALRARRRIGHQLDTSILSSSQRLRFPVHRQSPYFLPGPYHEKKRNLCWQL